MQYFIVLKLLRLQVTEFLYYFTYFSCLSKKNPNAKKPTGLGFLKKRVF